MTSLIAGDTRTLARRVRMTWLPLLMLAVMTLAAIPVDGPAVLLYWPPALTLAYAVTVAGYLRAAGADTRVLPYGLTDGALTALITAAWLAQRQYVPSWMSLLDGLLAPAGAVGMALLVLTWLERNAALLVFTLGYLAVVLVPANAGWDTRPGVDGGVLLLGAIGFAVAHRYRPRKLQASRD